MKRITKYLPLGLLISLSLFALGTCAFVLLQGKTLANPKCLYLLILWLFVAIWGMILKTRGGVTIKYPLPEEEKPSLDLITILAKY